MEQTEENKSQMLLDQLSKSAVYYWPEINRRVPSSYQSHGAYLPGVTIRHQKYYVPPFGVTPKKT